MKQKIICGMLLGSMLALTACGGNETPQTTDTTAEEEQAVSPDTESGSEATTEETEETEVLPAILTESGADGHIDFDTLQAENPDIFAWIYVPGTNIDYPVCQSFEADDWYESHNALGESDDTGAIYTEIANLQNMCDFNTVFHGKTFADGSMFSELFNFADPEFFDNTNQIYIYTEDNQLTYQIFAAFERPDNSLIRTYDFTYASGCEQFLAEEVYVKEMGKQLKEGWEGLNAYNFLVTLTTKASAEATSQYVVLGALVSDAAGTIDRIVE